MAECFDRILVPLDGSKMAEAVLPLVGLMAQGTGASVTLLHIIEERAPATVHGQPHLTTPLAASGYLDEVAAQLGSGVEHVEIEQHVHGTGEQDVATSIASHAEELHADLIAMCTHGRSDIGRVVFGSMAQQVLKRAKVPVLLVRPEAAPTEQLRTLLVPLDGSADGEFALPIASAIAKACRASLHLVRVVATVGTMSGDRSVAARLVPRAAAAALDVDELQAQEYLAEQVGKLARQGVRASAEVRRGERVQELAAAAASHSADMTAIATHGRAGLNAYWIGSVAQGLMNKLREPILLVKLPD